MGGFPKTRGTFWGAHNQDDSTWGSPIVGKLPCCPNKEPAWVSIAAEVQNMCVEVMASCWASCTVSYYCLGGPPAKPQALNLRADRP